MSKVLVRKLDHRGREQTTYEAEITHRDAHCVVMPVLWTRKEIVTGYTTFAPGDLLIETFYTDRWYNVMELRAPDDTLKGWYANITRPTRVRDSEVEWEDLKLDVWMSASGDALVLDEEEFDAISGELQPDEAITARAAVHGLVEELLRRWREHANAQIAQRLAELGWTIGTAESCTGGLIGDVLTNRSGCSSYFMGGVIAYENRIKRDVLGVSEATLAQHGAVSESCALEMVRGARRVLGVDAAVSATGIAGPMGGSADKPVGLVYIGLSTPAAERVERHVWHHDRLGNKRATADAALKLLMKSL